MNIFIPDLIKRYFSIMPCLPKRFLILFFLLSFLLPQTNAQQLKKNRDYILPVHPTTQPVVIDGDENDKAWKEAAMASSFFMVLPMDTSKASLQTEVKMCYDDKRLYLLAICYTAGTDMVESLRRDFAFQRNDNFLVFIDPFEDGTNGFSFGTNAAGAQWDGLMYEGGKVDLSWDHKWTSAVRRYPNRWVVELSIPFKTLRYRKNIRTWGINFSRNDLKTTEKSSWAPVPRQFPTASLAYTGTLLWDTPPPPPGVNVSLIPYVLGGKTKDYQTGKPGEWKNAVGADAKISLTSALNLDLTVNPDFSQVEVDRQVTNLSRYELFFPEKRQFFLENGDQLNNFGYPGIRPFFSRRIGLGVPIDFGLRLSGKLDRNWRIGLLDMQTKSESSIGLPAQNYAALAVQRRIFARSNISFLMVNKQSLQNGPNDSSKPYYTPFNRNVGMEFNLASQSNLWTGKLLILKSFAPGIKGNDIVQAGNLQYASKRWLINGAYEYTGKNYTAEVGYVPRRGYFKANPQISYFFFPAMGAVLTHGPQVNATYYFTPNLKQTDNETLVNYLITFRNKATLAPVFLHDYVQLLFPYDPSNLGIDSLRTGSRHAWNTIGLDFISRPQSVFTYDYSIRYGGYYAEGKKFTIAGDIGYRIQPYVNMLLSFSVNDLTLPQPWGHARFWLAGPKVDITFTNKLFFTTYIQYNSQINNTNINARLQWRYKPASDLFIVYTDNYFNFPFSVRNRAFVIKFNYWWSGG